MIYNSDPLLTYERSAPDATDFKIASDIQHMEDPYRRAAEIRSSTRDAVDQD